MDIIRSAIWAGDLFFRIVLSVRERKRDNHFNTNCFFVLFYCLARLRMHAGQFAVHLCENHAWRKTKQEKQTWENSNAFGNYCRKMIEDVPIISKMLINLLPPKIISMMSENATNKCGAAVHLRPTKSIEIRKKMCALHNSNSSNSNK